MPLTGVRYVEVFMCDICESLTGLQDTYYDTIPNVNVLGVVLLLHTLVCLASR